MRWMIIAWGASATIGIFAYLILTKRHKDQKEVPCDTCALLRIKSRRRSVSAWRYICAERGGFDTPPEYCGYRAPRSGEGGHDAD